MIQVVSGLDSISEPFSKTAVAIGVFDGVHLGHQEILHQTAREGSSQALTPLALTFDIHPAELFSSEHSPAYIASRRQRAELIGLYGGGIEAVVMVRFDLTFASLSPQEFVSGVLEAKLGARHVLVGADFCYGKGRAGTVTTLVEAGARNGFAVTVVPPILLDGERVSSTQIRGLIAAGNLTEALRLLGHPFVIEGRVVAGKKLGRTLGYPTANLAPIQSGQLIPGPGVYAAYANLEDGRSVRTAVSIGTNPTTDQDGLKKIEAYLMDGFSEDIYGQLLGLDLRLKTRDEMRFDALPALVAQMDRDTARIGSLLP
jgi:riboflavin kinase/FMN adenylyltransferase